MTSASLYICIFFVLFLDPEEIFLFMFSSLIPVSKDNKPFWMKISKFNFKYNFNYTCVILSSFTLCITSNCVSVRSYIWQWLRSTEIYLCFPHTHIHKHKHKKIWGMIVQGPRLILFCSCLPTHGYKMAATPSNSHTCSRQMDEV